MIRPLTSITRTDTLVPDTALFRCGEGRVVGLAAGRGSVAQEGGEVLLAPGTDAGLGGRRDVGGIEGAERRLQRAAPGQPLAAALDVGVAAEAAGRVEDVAAALDGAVAARDRKSVV